VVRRDPFAMLPFCGYNMSDYFQHWLDMEQALERAGSSLPRICCVNWFRKGADGKFVWPGYGENMRALKWMIDRIEGSAQGEDNLFGISPTFDEINWSGLSFTPEQFHAVTHVDPQAWQQELALHAELFQQLAYHLPPALNVTRERMAQRLAS
jgi:phosphoenolpyruvate carboxykinase (GTP)